VRAIGQAPVDLARFGNEYIQRNEPWNLVDDDPDAAATVIRDCVQIAKACGVLAAATLPGKAQDIWAQLGEDGDVADVELSAALESPPAEFGEPDELFEGIEDERVEELDATLDDKIASAEEASDDEAGDESDEESGDGDESEAALDLDPVLDERIGFEEFQDMDLRVGRIEAAEPIEGADELIRMEVDIGVETRQIVAGLRQLHDVDSLPGTKVIVVANLEKAELFGTESNGMVLAAGEQADLLTTHEDAVPGTRVR
jgi:methionyl-tRNA synthetase